MDILQVNRVSAMRYAGISFAENTMDNAVCKTFKKSKACKWISLSNRVLGVLFLTINLKVFWRPKCTWIIYLFLQLEEYNNCF